MQTWLLAVAIACSVGDYMRIADAAKVLLQGDDEQALARLAVNVSGSPDACDALRVARLSMEGWREARGLAAKGGPVELLGPVSATIKQLQELQSTDAALEAEYATLAIRAAVAAAQDERPEMQLLLTHARDLSERLVRRGRVAAWPRPFNLLAAELWFEVDRYGEAREAYERAASTNRTPIAVAGLARVQARLGNTVAACQAYRQIGDAAEALRNEARTYLATCP